MAGRAALVLAVLLAALWLVSSYWPAQHSDETPAVAAPEATAEPPSAAPRLLPSRPPALATSREPQSPASFSQPASLLGSELDGSIDFDADGRLISNRELRRRFDYLLSALGEQDLASLRAAFTAELLQHFDPDQVAQVMREFDHYVDYLRAVEDLVPDPAWTLEQRIAVLRDLQRERLGSERADAWFGEENRYTEATLARLRGETPAPESVDPAWLQAELQATEHHLVLEQSRQFDAAALPEQQRYQQRSELFGAEAAQRLAELDVEQASWQARLNGYARQRAALMADQNLTPEQREQQLQELLQQGFDERERRRVLSLQEVDMLPDDGG